MPKSPRTFAVIVFCVLAAVVIAAGSVFYVERVNRNRERWALTDAKLLGLATLEYAQDHSNHYPDAGKWEQELQPYIGDNAKPGFGDIVHPPAPMGGTPRRFSLNPALSEKSSATLPNPSNVWLFYESVSPAPSASDALVYFPVQAKDGGDSYAVVWGDGHCYLRSAAWKQGIEQHLPGF